MKEIQAYHKASAEALELQVETFGKEGIFYFPETFSPLTRWEPDIDHNQMAMIENKLIEKGYFIETNIGKHSGTVLCNTAIFKVDWDDKGQEHYHFTDKDKRIAFMRVFMEYIKTKK